MVMGGVTGSTGVSRGVTSVAPSTARDASSVATGNTGGSSVIIGTGSAGSSSF